MSAHANPDITTDGLVFMYDTGSGKSYKGEPTTNTAVTTGMATYWNNSGTAAWSSNDTNVPRIFTNLPVFSMEKLTDGNSHIGIGSTSATVSTEYTYSVYVWIPSSNSVNMAGSSPYFRPQPANASVGNLTYEGSAAWGTWPRDQWVRVSRTATTQATNVTSAYISCYLNTAGDKIYFTAPQFEQKGHLTPFVDGTRSATAGLLDLTKNATIDLTNMSFDSNAQMTFDGTDDTINTGLFAGRNPATDPFTIEAIVKSDITSGQRIWIDATDNGSNQRLYCAYAATGTGNPMGIQGSAWSSSVVNDTDYHHYVIVMDGSVARLYNNGEAHSTKSYTSYQIQALNIGGRNTYRWLGDIPILKLYNRALTAAEVLQNFNATKSRFNL
jgi:hypothetical protein